MITSVQKSDQTYFLESIDIESDYEDTSSSLERYSLESSEHMFEREPMFHIGDKEVIQTKLKMGAPNNKYEQEANRMAELVVNQQTSPALHTNKKKKNPLIQRIASSPKGGLVAPESVNHKLKQKKGSGNQLPPRIQASMEQSFGVDFSQVRIHTDREANLLNQQLGARAFTYGQDVYFNQGEFNPSITQGQKLLAHELTHVIQQGGNNDRIVQRDYSEQRSRDWVGDAVRMTTTELESEVHRIREHLINSNYSQETSYYNIGLGIFENELSKRGDIRTSSQIINQELRQNVSPMLKHRLNSYPGLENIAFISTNAQSLFVLNFCTGFASELPPHEVKNLLIDIINNRFTFLGGYVSGLPEGLWNGLSELFEGLGTLIMYSYKLSPIGGAYYAVNEIVEFAKDPSAYLNQIYNDYQIAIEIIQALQSFSVEFKNDPGIILQFSEELGTALGIHCATGFTNGFLRKGTFDKGYLTGNIAGYILFEVLLEVILLLTTEGVGNIIRGMGAVGQGVRKGGRVASIINRMLEASPAMKRILRTANKGDDLVDGARISGKIIETSTEIVPVVISGKKSQKARTAFNRIRNGYAKRLGVNKGGQVHHAIELQVLDRYPGVYTQTELNSFGNMRGIPNELLNRKQLHNVAIRGNWNRHYKKLNSKIAAKRLLSGTSEYKLFVREYLEMAKNEIDNNLGQFFSEQRKKIGL